MRKILLLYIVSGFLIGKAISQSGPVLKKNPASGPSKGNFFIYWGYNKEYFSKTDLRFSGPEYDFTLTGVTASDRPAPFSFDGYFNPRKMWVPQYNYRLGYFITDKLSLSLGMDHMKYVMNNGQMAGISGFVSQEASEKYQGTYQNDSILLTPDFLTFEHTNGFNLLGLDAECIQPLKGFLNGHMNISLVMGLGVGGMIPKTDVRVFGEGLDNRFHLAGYSVSAKIGSRVHFLKRFFISAEARPGYASLPSVLIRNEAPERASHNLWYLEYFVVGGLYIGKKTK